MANETAEGVWAGLGDLADGSAGAAALAGVDAAGGMSVEAHRLTAVALFAEAEAAAAWLADALVAAPDSLCGVLLPDDAVAEPGRDVENALLGLMDSPQAGEIAVARSLGIPHRLRDWDLAAATATGGAIRLAVPRDAREDATAFVPRATGRGAPAKGPAQITAPAPTATGTQAEIGPGYVVSHTYEIERRIGQGGMGTVYLARHVDLGSAHAIKVISPENAGDEHVVALFRKEAETLRSVRHDAIVAHEGAIRDEQGRLYLVMEFADGPALSSVLKEHALGADAVEVLAWRVGTGLEVAHDKGIVHRDLSPDNVILVDEDVARAQIIDFGIARNTVPGGGTLIGDQFAGKYGYASPEQLGLFGGSVDRRSDIYSLGLVIAAALGQPIRFGSSPADAMRGRETVPDLDGFSEPWRSRLALMLEPDPRDRPASYAETLDLTGGAAPEQRTRAAPRAERGSGGKKANGPRRRGGRLATILGLMVLVVGGGVGAWQFGLLGPPPSEDVTVTTEDTTEAATGVPAGKADTPPQPAPPSDPTQQAEPSAPDGPTEATTEAQEPAETPDRQPPPLPSHARLPHVDAVRTRVADALAVVEADMSGCRRIDFTVMPGVQGYRVTLSGVVGAAAQRERLRTATVSLSDVEAVRSRIAVEPQPFCDFLALMDPADRFWSAYARRGGSSVTVGAWPEALADPAFAPRPSRAGEASEPLAGRARAALALAGEALGRRLVMRPGHAARQVPAEDAPLSDRIDHAMHLQGHAVDIDLSSLSEAETARLVPLLADLGFVAFSVRNAVLHADMRAVVPEDFGQGGVSGEEGGGMPADALAALNERGWAPGRAMTDRELTLPDRVVPAAGAPVAITLNAPDGVYGEGDPIEIDVTLGRTRDGPPERHVYVDFIDADGMLYHLMPNASIPEHRAQAGRTLRIGAFGVEGDPLRYTAAEPYGQNLLFVVSADKPLFDGVRPDTAERFSDYVPPLERAIARARSGSGDVYIGVRFFETVP